MDQIIARRQTAFCPEYQKVRTIYAEILVHPTLGDMLFDILKFDCEDAADCAFAQGVPFCPFLVEILRNLKSR